MTVIGSEEGRRGTVLRGRGDEAILGERLERWTERVRVGEDGAVRVEWFRGTCSRRRGIPARRGGRREARGGGVGGVERRRRGLGDARLGRASALRAQRRGCRGAAD